MHFELLTLAGVKYTGEVSQVSLTTAEGEIGILPHHEILTAIALPGKLTIRTKGKTEVFATFGGLFEVTAQQVRLLADEAESADELVASEVEAALKQAEALRAAAKDKKELSRAQELVDRQQVRLGVVRVRHHQRPPRPDQSGK